MHRRLILLALQHIFLLKPLFLFQGWLDGDIPFRITDRFLQTLSIGKGCQFAAGIQVLWKNLLASQLLLDLCFLFSRNKLDASQNILELKANGLAHLGTSLLHSYWWRCKARLWLLYTRQYSISKLRTRGFSPVPGRSSSEFWSSYQRICLKMHFHFC